MRRDCLSNILIKDMEQDQDKVEEADKVKEPGMERRTGRYKNRPVCITRHKFRLVPKSERFFIKQNPTGSQERASSLSPRDVLEKLDFFHGLEFDEKVFMYTCQLLVQLFTFKYSSCTRSVQNMLFTLVEKCLEFSGKFNHSIEFCSFLERMVDTTKNAIAVVMSNTSLGKYEKLKLESINDKESAVKALYKKHSSMTFLIPESILFLIMAFSSPNTLYNFAVASKACSNRMNLDNFWKIKCEIHSLQFVTSWKLSYMNFYRIRSNQEPSSSPLQMCSLCRTVYWIDNGHPTVPHCSSLPYYSQALPPSALIYTMCF